MDAIITAAGRNSRMVEDFRKLGRTPVHKLRLKIDNKAILIHTLENVLNSEVDKVTLALGHYRDELIATLEEYDMLDKVELSINPDVDVGLSKTIKNAIKSRDKYYLFMAADQPTVTTKTINRLITSLNESPNPHNTISVLARRKYGWLDSSEGLGMPFCCYANLLYEYIENEDDDLNPILRQMISDGVKFYGIKEENELELININHLDDYLFVKEKIEKNGL